MSYKNCIEVKVTVDAKGVNTRKHDGRAQVVQTILKGESAKITYKSKTLKKMLESVGCEVRDGVTGGCYGSRDGSSSEGFTVWIDASELPEREYDKDLEAEVVNIFSLISNYGGEIVEGLDGDVFEEACENLGLNVGKDNTYNYAGHDAETPVFLVDADFAVISSPNGSGSAYLSIKFHCGGDIRGNYTDRVVFKFSSVDDIWGVIHPSCELSKEEVG